MKYAVYDYSNRGLLAVSTDTMIVRLLKNSLFDTDIRCITPKYSYYNGLTNDLLMKEDKHLYIDTTANMSELLPIAWNEPYLERRELAKLRYQCCLSMRAGIDIATSTTYATSRWAGIDAHLMFAIDRSNPELGNYSPGVKEYAAVLDLAPCDAYQELKLHADSLHSLAMRVYSLVTYFEQKLRNVVDKETKEIWELDFHDRFYRDSWI
jgi:hypothetical protein